MASRLEIKRIFDLQSDPANIVRLRNSTYKERIDKIKRIQNFVLKESNHQIISEALYKIEFFFETIPINKILFLFAN